jgi:hypothetical protein
MDETISQVFKAFNHVARELQIYFISGFLVLVNTYFALDPKHLSFLEAHKSSAFFGAGVIIVAYVLGHVCMAVYYVLLEWTKLEKVIDRVLRFKNETPPGSLPLLFQKDSAVYLHFVERYVLLSLMRWNLSAAFFIMSITHFVLGSSSAQFVFAIACLIIAFALYVLMLCTEEEKMNRVKSLLEPGSVPTNSDFAA